MGLIFKKVVLHNFLSYNHAEFDLQNRGFCLIKGENNFAKDNAKSNGAGKSAAFSAICFAITGMTINGLHTNLKNIFNDEPDSYVELTFSYNTDNYIITRYIAPKSDLTIIQNGINVSGKGIKESSKKLEEMLPDLNKDLIASTIILGQSMPSKFSSFSPSGRKELLEKLTKSDFMLEDIKTRLADRQAVVGGEGKDNEKSIIQANTQIGSYQTQIDTLTAKLAAKQAEDLEALKKQIKDKTEEKKYFDNEYAQARKNLADIAKDMADHNEASTKTLTAKQLELNELLAKYSADKTPIEAEKTSCSTEIRVLTEEVTRLDAVTDTCPTCGQKIPGAHKPDTSAQKAKISTLTESYKGAEDKLAKLATEYNEKKEAIDDKYATIISENNEKLRWFYQCQRDQEANEAEAILYGGRAEDALKELLATYSGHETAIKTLSEQITENQENMQKVKDSLAVLEAEKLRLNQHSAVLKKMDTLVKRDFRGYLLQNIIAFLDNKAKEYCDIVFGTKELNIYLDGNNLDISYCGKMLDNLSGGERTRVDLIIQLSIRELMCTYFGYNSNIIVLDEITDFLDSKSCERVMSLVTTQLQNIESVFIISHHQESLDIPIDTEIRIVKSVDGISSIY